MQSTPSIYRTRSVRIALNTSFLLISMIPFLLPPANRCGGPVWPGPNSAGRPGPASSAEFARQWARTSGPTVGPPCRAIVAWRATAGRRTVRQARCSRSRARQARCSASGPGRRDARRGGPAGGPDWRAGRKPGAPPVGPGRRDARDREPGRRMSV